MDRGYSLAHLILASVLVLTPLMAVVDAQAQIAFVSKRDGNPEIYVMDADGKNQRRLIPFLNNCAVSSFVGASKNRGSEGVSM